MYWLVYIFISVVRIFLGVLCFAMFARAILSWLPLDDDNPIEIFLYAITEPLITPVRMLVEKSETLASMPIDISFFITVIILSVLMEILP